MPYLHSVEEWRESLRKVYEDTHVFIGQPQLWDGVLLELRSGSLFEIDERALEALAAQSAWGKDYLRSTVQEYLLIEAIAKRYTLSVTSEDLNAYYSQYEYLKQANLSDYEKALIEKRALRQKVIDYMVYEP